MQVVSKVVVDTRTSGVLIPVALADKHYGGRFQVRIPPAKHRTLVLQDAERGISLNQLVGTKLSA